MVMHDLNKFYINGQWVEPNGQERLDVLNPATEQVVSRLSVGSPVDVDCAVQAASAAFEHFSQTDKPYRKALLERIIEQYQARIEELALATTEEMGAPIVFSRRAQVMAGLEHLTVALNVLKENDFTERLGTTTIVKEPVGVCGMITPWNWPLNQMACKVAPALAAGCTMVLKPSELAPRTAYIFAQILEDAGVPAGVFNLINGTGALVGAALSAHPLVDMISFTGSTRAGKQVSIAAAENVKRVSLELGGKSANIILDDVDFSTVITRSVKAVMSNTGQSCNARTKIVVPEHRLADTIEIAKAAAESIRVGDPMSYKTQMGPVASFQQWERVQAFIQQGIDQGALLVTGGLGRPAGLEKGCFVRPTVFAHVTPAMTIAQEEIFGPVVSIMAYKTEEEAIAIANSSIYGLSGGVCSADVQRAKRVAARLRTGMVHLNDAATDMRAPFGGYKQSGNGREWGRYGVDEFMETKAIFGDLSN